MAEAETEGEDPPKKKGKKGLLIGAILAFVLGGGGFYSVYSGMILSPAAEDQNAVEEVVAVDLPPVAFIPLEPLVVSLGKAAQNRHLRFSAQLEVNPSFEDDVISLIPRVMDVLNSYLRAVSIRDLEDPAALVSLRAQMLRRVQLVTGDGRVRDLLIMEFVLN